MHWILGKVITLFEFYLSGRTFKVNFDKKFSGQVILLVAFPKDMY